MASNSSLQHLHNHHTFLKRHYLDTRIPLPCINFSSKFSQKPNRHLSLSMQTFSLSSTSPVSTTTTTNPKNSTSLDLLEQHLVSQNFRQADEETRRLLIALSGESSIKRGYVFFSETQFISKSDLISIDELWKKHSNGKFGYSIQKRIWEKIPNKDFTKFFIKLGWMKKLETEVLQYNYRAFPNEFVWELNEETPIGHLPLTNALRGTQLFTSILTHPAFENEDGEDDNVGEERESEEREKQGMKKTPLGTGLQTDYSF